MLYPLGASYEEGRAGTSSLTSDKGPSMIVLGIETSCDETAAAVVRDGTVLLSNIVASQVDVHARYGGVGPEVASRVHVLAILPVVTRAL